MPIRAREIEEIIEMDSLFQINHAVKLSAHYGSSHCVQYGSTAVILKASSQSNRGTTILRHTDISVRQTILLHRKVSVNFRVFCVS
jgi:hypothetical protein